MWSRIWRALCANTIVLLAVSVSVGPTVMIAYQNPKIRKLINDRMKKLLTAKIEEHQEEEELEGELVDDENIGSNSR